MGKRFSVSHTNEIFGEFGKIYIKKTKNIYLMCFYNIKYIDIM